MEQQNHQEKQHGFVCTGDCLKCNPFQRQYCAAQFTYNSMRVLERMESTMASMQGSVNELKSKIEAIQGNEATIFDPMAVVEEMPLGTEQEDEDEDDD